MTQSGVTMSAYRPEAAVCVDAYGVFCMYVVQGESDCGVVVLFPRVQGFWENVDNSFSACFFFWFCFKVEISSGTLIPLLRPGSVYSGSASWDDCD